MTDLDDDQYEDAYIAGQQAMVDQLYHVLRNFGNGTSDVARIRNVVQEALDKLNNMASHEWEEVVRDVQRDLRRALEPSTSAVREIPEDG